MDLLYILRHITADGREVERSLWRDFYASKRIKTLVDLLIRFSAPRPRIMWIIFNYVIDSRLCGSLRAHRPISIFILQF